MLKKREEPLALHMVERRLGTSKEPGPPYSVAVGECAVLLV